MNDRPEMKTKEPQYQELIDAYKSKGAVHLGLVASHLWRNDPRHLGFLLARYKFCAKMLDGKSDALEVGCGDGFGLAVVLQTVAKVHGIDFDPLFIESAIIQNRERSGASFEVWDMTQGPVNGCFQAALALDIIEHIPLPREAAFMTNICNSIASTGVCIIGTPNATASRYASEGSRIGHINLKTSDSLKALLFKYFHNVFIFSMNDEVVHTGYYPMAHYLFGLAVGVRLPGDVMPAN